MEYINYPYMGLSRIDMSMDLAWPLTFQDKSIQYNLNEALNGIRESVSDEKEDEMFYNFLISKVTTERDKKIIEDIRDNEIIHAQILRKVFTKLSGVILPTLDISNNDINYDNMTYMEGLSKAFIGELEAVEKYRKIMAFMPNKDLYNMIMYIMIDEIRHAIKYNYLIMMNK